MKKTNECFSQYYKTSFKPDLIKIPDLKFRHFRFQLFSETNRFLRLRHIIQTKEQLYEKIVDIIPLNAYFTPVRWLSPIFVKKTKTEIDVMLFSALYFDIDLEKKRQFSFDQTKETTRRLIDYIFDEYQKFPDLVVFSGRRGFHIYYWDWDTFNLRNMLPQKRIENFIARRKEILTKRRYKRNNG